MFVTVEKQLIVIVIVGEKTVEIAMSATVEKN